MRQVLIAALVGVTLLLAPTAHAEEVVQGGVHWPTAESLIANERAAWDVYARRDVDAPNLLSDDYVDLLPGGEASDRTAHLAAIVDADLTAYSLEGFRVIRLNDEAMLVTYEADWASSDGETGRVAVTSGWALRDGQWLNVFYRETPLG